MRIRTRLGFFLIGITYVTTITAILAGCGAPFSKNWQIFPNPGSKLCYSALGDFEVYPSKPGRSLPACHIQDGSLLYISIECIDRCISSLNTFACKYIVDYCSRVSDQFSSSCWLSLSFSGKHVLIRRERLGCWSCSAEVCSSWWPGFFDALSFSPWVRPKSCSGGLDMWLTFCRLESTGRNKQVAGRSEKHLLPWSLATFPWYIPSSPAPLRISAQAFLQLERLGPLTDQSRSLSKRFHENPGQPIRCRFRVVLNRSLKHGSRIKRQLPRGKIEMGTCGVFKLSARQ